MKVLSLHQPWATLIAMGVKTIETRSWKAPESLIGERFAIHAAKKRPHVGEQVGTWTVDWGLDPRHSGFTNGGFDEGCGYLLGQGEVGYRTDFTALPLGAIVATARLVECVPTESDGGFLHDYWPPERRIACIAWDSDGRGFANAVIVAGGGRPLERFEHQRPYGDFRPGRWAWLLADVEPVDPPVPFKGGQGLSRTWEP